MPKPAPLGIRLLCDIYLVNALLYLVSITIFENYIYILGKEAGFTGSWLIRLGFILIPLLLSFRLRERGRNALILALAFHLFFLINSVLVILESLGFLPSLVRIQGLYGVIEYSSREAVVVSFNILLNIFILAYLFSKRNLFLRRQTITSEKEK